MGFQPAIVLDMTALVPTTMHFVHGHGNHPNALERRLHLFETLGANDSLDANHSIFSFAEMQSD